MLPDLRNHKMIYKAQEKWKLEIVKTHRPDNVVEQRDSIEIIGTEINQL